MEENQPTDQEQAAIEAEETRAFIQWANLAAGNIEAGGLAPGTGSPY